MNMKSDQSVEGDSGDESYENQDMKQALKKNHMKTD